VATLLHRRVVPSLIRAHTWVVIHKGLHVSARLAQQVHRYHRHRKTRNVLGPHLHILNCYHRVFAYMVKKSLRIKRVWKIMSLPQKVEVLDRGMRFATVGWYYGVNESTICFCSKNEDKIKESVKPGVRRLRLTSWGLVSMAGRWDTERAAYQWCCGNRSHAVIQPIHRLWG
jgi:hypothetical protein